MNTIDRFSAISERIEMLQLSTSTLSLEGLLSSASKIRQDLMNDAEITEECNTNASTASKRRELLEQLDQFQTSLIDEVLSHANEIKNYNSKECKLNKNYSTARTQLMQLLNEELANEEGYSERYKTTKMFSTHHNAVSNVLDKCEKEKFVILLVGEYQSGKTTTFNALCGGKRIGAIGSGDVTTAVPVTISHRESSGVNIVWKTESELNELLSDLEPIREECSLGELSIHNDDLFYQIEKIRHGELLDREVDEDLLKAIAISSIILGRNKIPSLYSKGIPVDRVGDITCFPEGFIQRWKKNGIASFSEDELVFAFIKQVDCYTPSEILKRMDCIVMDCPGLFANDYDTRVTEDAMLRANAILVILPHEKAFKKKMEDALYRIKNQYPDFKRKLIIANNLESSKKKSTLKANQDRINNIFPGMNVIPYDAMLAYVGQIRLSYDAGSLDEKTVDEFIRNNQEESPFDFNDTTASFEDVWQDVAETYFRGPYDPVAMYKNSKLDSLLDFIRDFVENNKANSIIFSDGIDALSKELMSIMDDIKLIDIDPFKKSGQERDELWQSRLETLNLYSESSDAIIENHLFKKITNKETLVTKLARCTYEKLFTTDVYEDIACSIGNAIYNNKGKIFRHCATENGRNQIKDYLKPIIADRITYIIERRINYWNDLMSSEQDVQFAELFVPAVSLMEAELSKTWNDLYKGDDSMKMARYVSINKTLKQFNINPKEKGADISVNYGPLFAALLAEIVTIATGIAITLAGIIVGFGAATPLGWVLLAIASIPGGIAVAVNGPEAIGEFFVENFIKPKVLKEFEEKKFHSILHKYVYDEIHNMLNNYKSSIKPDDEKMMLDKENELSISEDDREQNCYTSIGDIAKMNTQMDIYYEFRNLYTQKES